jgi:hypothetical protein
LAEDRTTVLEGIIQDIGRELYQKWYNALAIEDRTEEASKAMLANAVETSFWCIQEFMNRFNAAADVLKNEPSVD